MLDKATASPEALGLMGNFTSRKIWFSDSVSTPPVDGHLVHFSRLCIVISGSYEFDIGIRNKRQRIHAYAGDAVFIPPKCWDAPTWNKHGKTLTLLYAPRQTGYSLNLCDGDGKVISIEKGILTGPLKNEGKLMEQALIEMAYVNQGNPAASNLVQALIQHCHYTASTEVPEISRSQSRWESICLYLQENMGQEVTRESVASFFSMSPNHLSKLFRQEGKVGFNGYLTLVRIAQAKRLLTQYSLNLEQISAQTGFSCGDYFGRVFRKYTGHTPGEYRNIYQTRQNNYSDNQSVQSCVSPG